MLSEIVRSVRAERPVVHCITNYVTANDCANLLLACGASPVMADDPEEAAEITSACSGLVINMGTPNPRKLEAMYLAGRRANDLGHPVVLDPVGVCSSGMRMREAKRLLETIRFAAIRGNASEIRALVSGRTDGRGVDAGKSDGEDLEWAKRLALETGSVIVMTGEADIVTDGRETYRVRNGHSMMRLVTGAGCQLSALLGAYEAANAERPIAAALAAACAMGVCGEIAHERLEKLDGNASYRNYIIDAICNMKPEEMEARARYEKC